MTPRLPRHAEGPPRDPRSPPPDGQQPATITTLDDAPTPRRLWCCRACQAPITRPDDAIVVDGRHDHRCVNPSGAIYDVGCFGAGTHLTRHGEPETYFSWFRGFAWQVATCDGCGAHLGWAFSQRNVLRFWGLILARLTLVDPLESG